METNLNTDIIDKCISKTNSEQISSSTIKDNTNLPQQNTEIIDLETENTEHNNTENTNKNTAIIDLSTESDLPQNVILLGSKITTNTDQEKKDSVCDEIELKVPKIEVEEVVKKQYKRRSELERLEVEKKEVFDDEYIAFSDNVNVYRKYKLRKVNNDPSPKKLKIEPEVPSLHTKLLEPLNCHRCPAIFYSRYSLVAHLREHDNIFLCLICSKRFNTNEELITHKATHEKQTFLCTECKLAFSEHLDYLLHYYGHIKEADIQCLECEMTIKLRNMKTHVLSHFTKEYQCPTCFLGFQNEGSYTNHRLRHGLKIFKRHSRIKCKECNKMVLLNNGEYDRHMYRHTGVKKYQCLYCGNCYITDSSRNQHSRIHLGKSNFKCDACEKVFNVEFEYKRHILRHGTRNVECDMCGKKFFDKYALQYHIKNMHMKRDLYPCPECEYKGTSQTGLRSHMIWYHTTEKPFSCDICKLSLKTKRDLERHYTSKSHKRNVFALCNGDDK